MSIISIVVAMDRLQAIGKDGGMPWHLPADLKYFRQITWGKPIVMGRKTHESIGKPLPGRENIVISHNPRWQSPGCIVVPSLENALAHTADTPETMIIGGATIYQLALPLAQRIYLTEVHADIGGDVYFPLFDQQEWQELSRSDHPADTANRYAYSFVQLQRR